MTNVETVEGRPVLSDFCYKKYTLEHLENWVLDSLSCEDITAKEVYDTIVKAVNDNVNYHRKALDKNIGLLYLLKGHRDVELGNEPYDGWDENTTTKVVCDKNDTSEHCKKQWDEFWEAL